MEKENFIEDFYEEYGFYPPENINSWEEWNESQDYMNYLQKASQQPREVDKPIIY